MKKVLIISTHFAPDAHVGAKRITKFCKFLPQYGWKPIIITSDISDYHRLDETLIKQLPKDIEIYSASGKQIEFSTDKDDSKINIYPETKSSGLFYLVMYTEKSIITKKVLFLNKG